jgi:hypothetical protein
MYDHTKEEGKNILLHSGCRLRVYMAGKRGENKKSQGTLHSEVTGI